MPDIQEEEAIGDVDLFTLTDSGDALTVNAKWLQHLEERLLGEDGHPRKASGEEDPHRMGLVLEWVYGTIVSTAEKARDCAKRALGARLRFDCVMISRRCGDCPHVCVMRVVDSGMHTLPNNIRCDPHEKSTTIHHHSPQARECPRSRWPTSSWCRPCTTRTILRCGPSKPGSC